MKTVVKPIAAAALAAGATVMGMPANAQVSPGIQITPSYKGIQVGSSYDRHWCHSHPGLCGSYGYYSGSYRPDRGYWWHNHWWHHRYWDRDHWRYGGLEDGHSLNGG